MVCHIRSQGNSHGQNWVGGVTPYTYYNAFSVGGVTKCHLKKKNLHHFCFWHPLSFDFYIVMISSGTNENFLPDRLKKLNPAGQPSDYDQDCPTPIHDKNPSKIFFGTSWPISMKLGMYEGHPISSDNDPIKKNLFL